MFMPLAGVRAHVSEGECASPTAAQLRTKYSEWQIMFVESKFFQRYASTQAVHLKSYVAKKFVSATALSPEHNGSTSSRAYPNQSIEQLWQMFFSDPSQWWDHRFYKENARYPDFKHKKTQKGLWINVKSPAWVKAKLAAIPAVAVQRSVFSWTAAIASSIRKGDTIKALEIFRQMQADAIRPNKFTYIWILKALNNPIFLEEGQSIHRQIKESGLTLDIFVGSCLIGMYCRCGSIEDAWTVFQGMPHQDIVSWSTLIVGFVRCGLGRRALDAFIKMGDQKVKADGAIFLAALNACSSVGALEEGRHIHRQIIDQRLNAELWLGNQLIDMYCKCSSIEDACGAFNNMKIHDTSSWNAMIGGYMKCSRFDKSMELYEQMQREHIAPDSYTFVSVINACAGLQALEEGRTIHKQVALMHYQMDIFVGTCLLHMYINCDCIEDACRAFGHMPKADTVSWNTMLQGYVKSNQAEKVPILFWQMQREDVPPDITTFLATFNGCASTCAVEMGRQLHANVTQKGWTSDAFIDACLIDMYANCNSIEDACTIFTGMESPDLVTWNTMILGYVNNGMLDKALDLFLQMPREHVEPDKVTCISALGGCVGIESLEYVKLIHSHCIQRGWELDIVVGSCLVNMYGKCGRIEDASRVFESMPIKDVASWNAMILAFVRCDFAERVLELFQEMQHVGVEPINTTFVVILNACASLAALEEGRKIHSEIIKRGLGSDHYVSTCLIDMYAKCGSIVDAWKVLHEMPRPDIVAWNTMLGGYAKYGLWKEAIRLVEQIFEEDADMDSTTFLTLLSAFRHAGKVDEAQFCIESLTSLYCVPATLQHYGCMIDLLARCGHLIEAMHMIKVMPFEPDPSVWTSLLGACRRHHNKKEVSEMVAKQVLTLDPESTSAYILLSNIYAAS